MLVEAVDAVWRDGVPGAVVVDKLDVLEEVSLTNGRERLASKSALPDCFSPSLFDQQMDNPFENIEGDHL